LLKVALNIINQPNQPINTWINQFQPKK
jgi:hypothetical protein